MIGTKNNLLSLKEVISRLETSGIKAIENEITIFEQKYKEYMA